MAMNLLAYEVCMDSLEKTPLSSDILASVAVLHRGG
jgi:hypothetical protein